jgi:hypothetical protein
MDGSLWERHKVDKCFIFANISLVWCIGGWGFTLTLHSTISHIVVDVHGALEMIVTN